MLGLRRGWGVGVLGVLVSLAMLGCPTPGGGGNGGGTGTPTLVATPQTLDFGTSLNTLSFKVSVASGAKSVAGLSITPNQSWLSVSYNPDPASWVGGSLDVTVTLDRGALAGGDNIALINVSATGLVPTTVSVTAKSLLTVNFNASNRTPYAGDAVTFQDASVFSPGTGPILSWFWNFGDGQTSSQQNPSHAYSQAGTYTVSLTVATPATTVTRTRTAYIAVQPRTVPTADFTASILTPATNDSVYFTDLSVAGSMPITSRQWNFGDGQTSNEQNPVHSYAQAGTYTVSLTVTTAHGTDTETKFGYITVHVVAPIANFVVSNVLVQANTPVVFNDISISGTAPITQWLWNFGDGGTSNDRNPSHTYTAKGVYAVSLTVTSAHGSNTVTRPNYLTVIEVAPKAEFSASPLPARIDTPVQFTDRSAPGTAPITQWLWNFGDGGTSTLQNPSHTYTTTGAFTVTLTVTTAHGTDTRTKLGYMAVVKKPPLADFAASPVDPTVNSTVQFEDRSLSYADTEGVPIASWLWNFGDGGTSTQQSPAHTYSKVGKFDVSLTVSNTHGVNTATKTGYVTVRPDFTANTTDASIGEVLTFTPIIGQGASVAGYLWNFGDGYTSTAQVASHMYGGEGVYTVSLEVRLLDGSRVSTIKSQYVTVSFKYPKAQFIVSDLNPSMYETVTFTDESDTGSALIDRWEWSYREIRPDTTPGPFTVWSTGQNTTQTWTAPAVYEVRLVLNRAGADGPAPACVPTVDGQGPVENYYTSQIVSVGGVAPEASFVIIDNTDSDLVRGMRAPAVVFRDLTGIKLVSTSSTQGGGRIVEYQWRIWKEGGEYPDASTVVRSFSPVYDIIPGSTSLRQYPFRSPGMYTVQLSVLVEAVTNPRDPDDPLNTSSYVADTETKTRCIEVLEPTALDRYVQAPDAAAVTNHVPTVTQLARGASDQFTAYTMDIASLVWESEQPTNPNLWRHNLTIIHPDNLSSQTMLLYLNTNETGAARPTSVDPALSSFAVQSKMAVAVLDQVPNQPSFYPAFGEAVKGNKFISASLKTFLDTNDPNTIVFFPIAKAAKKAMDTVRTFMANPNPPAQGGSGNYPPVLIEDCIVFAGSEDSWMGGWASYMAAIADTRVRGLISLGFDGAGLREQFGYQRSLEDQFGFRFSGVDAFTQPSPLGYNIDSALVAPEVGQDYYNTNDIGYRSFAMAALLRRDAEKVRQLLRAILWDLMDEYYFPRVDAENEFDHYDALRNLLDLPGEENLDSFHEIRDHVSAVKGSLSDEVTLIDQLLLQIDNAMKLAPDERDPWVFTPAIAGYDTGLYGGLGGQLLQILATMEEELLKEAPREYLVTLVDPVWYAKLYTLGGHLEHLGAGRLRAPTYSLLSPGDICSPPDSAKFYFPYLAGDNWLRYFPNSDRTLGGNYLSLLAGLQPWVENIAYGTPAAVPKLTWTFADNRIVRVNAPGAKSLNLYIARREAKPDFRLGAGIFDSPVWVSTPIQSGMPVQLLPALNQYAAFFVEATYDDYVITSDVAVQQPYQAPHQ